MLSLAGCRVAVTGATGFLGRAVCDTLRGRGCDPIALRYDLTDQTQADRWFREAQPDVVIHLAAEVGGIGANQRSPGRFMYSNLLMGINVIERCRDIQNFVLVGSVCAYPKHCTVPFVEDDLWRGYPEETNAGYGIAKRCLGELLSQYFAQYGMRSAYVIPTNLYGPHDNFSLETSHVIPALIRRCCEAAGEPVTVWGSGSASREFLHVADAAEAVVRAAERIQTPEPVNLPGCGEITIATLAEKIAAACGHVGGFVWDQSRPDGQPRRCLDGSRARRLLDWQPQRSLDDGIRETVEWYRSCRP